MKINDVASHLEFYYIREINKVRLDSNHNKPGNTHGYSR